MKSKLTIISTILLLSVAGMASDTCVLSVDNQSFQFKEIEMDQKTKDFFSISLSAQAESDDGLIASTFSLTDTKSSHGMFLTLSVQSNEEYFLIYQGSVPVRANAILEDVLLFIKSQKSIQDEIKFELNPELKVKINCK